MSENDPREPYIPFFLDLKGKVRLWQRSPTVDLSPEVIQQLLDERAQNGDLRPLPDVLIGETIFTPKKA